MQTLSVSQFVSIFFIALALFQRVSEVFHSNKNLKIASFKWGALEAHHIGWCALLFITALIFEPLFNFWFLLLYLVTQALRLWDVHRADKNWNLQRQLANKNGLLLFARFTEGFALPFAFGYFEVGAVLGVLNLGTILYLQKRSSVQ